MKRHVVTSLAVVISCTVVAWILFLAAWDWSLTTAKVTVLVNDVDSVDGANCVWHGRQYFDVIFEGMNARINIVSFKTEPNMYLMGTLIKFGNAEQPEIDSITFRLIYTDAQGQDRDVRMTPKMHAPRIHRYENEQVRMWSQQYRISKDLAKLTEKQLRLVWSMEYRDANGDMKEMSITVPLRKEEITSPSSIVRLEAGQPHSLGRTQRRGSKMGNDSLVVDCGYLATGKS
jgi:hypothetical protein